MLHTHAHECLCRGCYCPPPPPPPGNIPEIPASVHPDCADFLKRCLAVDPDERWSAQRLLDEHPWVAGGASATAQLDAQELAAKVTASGGGVEPTSTPRKPAAVHGSVESP